MAAAAPAFWAIRAVPLDINVRESAGSAWWRGRLGMALDTAFNLFQWTARDILVAILRRRSRRGATTQLRKRII